MTYEAFLNNRKFDLFIIHKPIISWIDHERLLHIIMACNLVFENKIFYVLSKRSFWNKKSLDKTGLIKRLNRFENEPLKDRKIVLVHIPKSAGRTIYHNVRRHVQRHIYLQGSYSGNRDICFEQLNFIAGHISVYDYKQMLAGTECLWLSAIRHPVKRIMSLVAHSRRDEKAIMTTKLNSAMMYQLRTQDIRQLVNTDMWFKICTKSIRMLCGLPPNQITKETLKECLARAVDFTQQSNMIVGIQDNLKAFYAMVALKTGIPCDPLLRKNVSTNYSAISDAEKAFLESYTSDFMQMEMELYNEVCKMIYNENEVVT